MNKKIMFILTLCSTFLFFQKVNAEAYYYDFDNPENTTGTSKFTHLPINATLPEGKKDNYNLALEYLANKCSSYDSYIISNKGLTSYGYDKQIELFCFNQSNNQITPSVSVTKSYYDGNNYYVYLNFYANVYKSSSVNYYYARFYDDKRVSENPKLNNNTVSIQFVSGDLASLNFGDFPILKSNVDFSFNNNYPTSTDNKILLLSSFKLNGIIYNLGDFGYKNSELYDVNSKPSITILKTSEEKITLQDKEYIKDVSLKMNFSIIDNEKYLYMYKYGEKSEWSTITLTQSDSFTVKYEYNDTLYVQIMDKSSKEIVSSSQFTISSIDKLPDDYVYDNVDNDTVNTDGKVIFHKCTLSLESGIALCEVTLENYNNELYDYYYKIDNSSYSKIVPDEKTEVLPEVYDTSLFLKTNDDISLYQKWKKSTDNFVSYDFVVKLYHNSTITLMRETKDTGFKQYYTFTVTMLTEKNDMNQIEQFIYNHLLSKFYFIHQFKQIIEYVSSYNFEENAKAPKFTFDMSFIGLSPITVDMTISDHTRLLIHGYIKLFASVTVVVSFIRETSKLFKK